MLVCAPWESRPDVHGHFAAGRAELPPRPFTARRERTSRRDFVFGCDRMSGAEVWLGTRGSRAPAPLIQLNDIDDSPETTSMKPTVYLPLADLCPTGLRRPSTRSAAR